MVIMPVKSNDQVHLSENIREFYSFFSASGWVFLVISALMMIYLKYQPGGMNLSNRIGILFLAVYICGFVMSSVSFFAGMFKRNRSMLLLSSSCLVAYLCYMVILFRNIV